MPTIALCGMSIVAAVAGNAIYRDYDARMESLVYTTPISKRAFLGGRFVGTLADQRASFCSASSSDSSSPRSRHG